MISSVANVPAYKGRQLEEYSTLDSLRKKGVIVDGGKSISLKSAKNIGNKSWGRISFLVRFCGYFFNNAELTVYKGPSD
jgi:hypothetical protein